jgi:tRNA(fMet)-specific endonuclease VapC
MKYLLDTNALTAWIKKDAGFIANVQTKNPSHLAISVMTQHEVLFGIACNPQLRLRRIAENLIELLPKVVVGSGEVALAATIRADLKARGLPIGPHDLLIAATALANGLVMVTHNTREFSRVVGLAVEDWQQASPNRPQ